MLVVLGGNHHQHAFFDAHVFHLMSPTLNADYCKHEQEKHHAYKEKVCEVEYGCFYPLSFINFRWNGEVATVSYIRLANLLSTHDNAPYSTVTGWLHCTL